MSNWVTWLAAFMVVLAILSVAAALQEFIVWRRDRKR